MYSCWSGVSHDSATPPVMLRSCCLTTRFSPACQPIAASASLVKNAGSVVESSISGAERNVPPLLPSVPPESPSSTLQPSNEAPAKPAPPITAPLTRLRREINLLLQ